MVLFVFLFFFKSLQHSPVYEDINYNDTVRHQ